MKNLRLILAAALLSLTFSLERIKSQGDINITTKVTFNEVGNATERSEAALSEDEIVLQKWRNMEKNIKDLSSQAVKRILPFILRLSEGINISSRCSNSIMKMIYGIKDMKLWAYKMIDASGKIPNGFFGGFFSSLGDFDSCLSVDVPGRNPFRGQYCSIFITPPLPKRLPFRKLELELPPFINFSKKGTVMDELTSKAIVFYHLAIRTSVCIPSSCSREEVQAIVNNTIALTGMDLIVKVPTCDVIEPVILSNGDISVICILSVMFLLVFVATITDAIRNIFYKTKLLNTEASSTAVRSLMCFSAYANALKILKKSKPPSSTEFFHGMKVVTLLWVMMNHTYSYVNHNLSGNLGSARNIGAEIAFQVIGNGYPVVQTFFFISSVLLAYLYAGKQINIPLGIFYRVWRLAPTFMLVIATSTLIPHMGSGPGWKETVEKLIDNCKANWWTNLLFINNFISSKEVCLQWLWYIPVDTHLYIMALFVMVFYKNQPRLALGINALLFIVGTVATAVSHIYYRHQPTVIYNFVHPDDSEYTLDNFFFRTYTHITTCSIALCVGFYLATKPKLKIPMVINILGWLCSMLFGLVVIYVPYEWNQGYVPGLAVSTIYACTSKVAWALALSYVTIACFTGNGGIITSVLSWSAFVPLSRLTYVAYLIHPLFQLMYIGSTRIPISFDHKTMVYRYVGNVGIAYSFAFVVSLLFEAPFIGLSKILLASKIKPEPELKPRPECDRQIGMHLKYPEHTVSTISIKKVEHYLQ